MGGPAAFGPVQGAAHGLAQHFRRRPERRAFVETHRHVGAEVFLDGDGPFGREFEEGAVDVRTEDGGVVGDLARRGEAVDLEAATVGEDGAVPAHEAMQAAHLGDEVVAGTEGEVIGVAEDHVGAGRFELVRRQSLDGGLGADGHEDGRIDGAVRSVQPAEAGGAIGG